MEIGVEGQQWATIDNNHNPIFIREINKLNDQNMKSRFCKIIPPKPISRTRLRKT